MKLRAALLSAFAMLTCAACHDSSPGISVNIAAQYRDGVGGSVDLTKSYEADWDRVCFLAPFSSNATARSTLGFDWDAEGKTAIHRNNGIVLLLFVRAKEVAAYAEHPRNIGDFANLSGKCVPRAQARFAQQPASKQGPAGMYPKTGP